MDRMDKVKCEICGKYFARITNTHLQKQHNISCKEYKEKFFDANFDPKGCDRGKYTRGKTYEELYGEDKSESIKKQRGETLKETYSKNPDLRKSRGQGQKRKAGKRKMKKGMKKSTCKVCKKVFWYSSKDNSGIYCSKKCNKIDQSNISKRIWKTSRKNERGIKLKIIDERGSFCEKCGKDFSSNPHSLCLHHLHYNYYTSSDLSQFILLCKSCHTKLHNKIRREQENYLGHTNIMKSIVSLLESLGVSLDDPNFKSTPQRVARMYTELCFGLFTDINKEMKDILSTVFPSSNDEMIIYEGESVGMCPHHLLPVLYRFYIGIIPNGFVVGASKPQRIVDLLSSIPDIQEDITVKVKKAIQDVIKPSGIIVFMEGKHMCMRIRGIKAPNAVVRTSSLAGSFTKNEVRNEFLTLISKQGK